MGKTKHYARKLKSFLAKHADPEKHEKLKESRKEMEEKKKMIMNLIESHDESDGNQIHGSKKGPIMELVEDFHRHYESLFSHYDHLAGKLKDKVQKHEPKKETFSSDSDSDLGSGSVPDYSANGKDGENGKAENDLIEELKVEVERLNQEKSEKEELRMRVETAAKTEVELNQQIEELKKEKDDLVVAKEDAMRRVEDGNRSVESFKTQVDQLQNEKQSLELELGTIKQKVRDLEEEMNLAKEESENLSKSMKEAAEEANKYQESKLLEDKTSRLSHTIAANNEAYHGMIMNISENVNDSLTQMESIMTSNFEKDHCKLSNSIFKISEDIQVVKHCLARKNVEREQLEKELIDVNERAKKQRGEIEELKQSVSQLMKAAGELDVTLKEKDEQLSILEEEKRQAIRQLCLWSDNLWSRYHELKSILSKPTTERQPSR